MRAKDHKIGLRSCLYRAEVRHSRLRPKKHRLRYTVQYFLIDLDDLPELQRRFRWFSEDKANLFSFASKNFGDGRPQGLKEWVCEQLAEAKIDVRDVRVELLCLPKIWGYAFNPLSIYYCRDGSGQLVAVLYQVSNTFGGRHTYVVDLRDESCSLAHHSVDKLLRVSPFNAVDGTYTFRINDPGEELFVGIHHANEKGGLINATLTGKRTAISDARLLRTALFSPFMTLKVIAGIHWEALKIWWKGVPYVSAPPANH